MLYKHDNELRSYEKQSSVAFLSIALSLLLFSGFLETISMKIPMGNSMLIYVALTTLVLSQIALRLKWITLISWLQGYLVLGGLLFLSLVPYYQMYHPFGDFGAISIALFFGVNYFQLYIFDDKWKMQPSLHLVSLWILTLIAVSELSYVVSLLSENITYTVVSEGVLLIIVLALLFQKGRFIPKIFASYVDDYRYVGAFGVIVMLLVWEIFSISLSGAPDPLPYLPLLNPLELVEIAGVYLIYSYFKNQENINMILGATLLLFLTIVLARSVHFYVGIDYSAFRLLDSIVFQMYLSILWGVLAMATMIIANSWKNRMLWISGASLIGLVVVKLFLIDLANSGGVERIVSFIAVGLLFLVVGYFAPLPPPKEAP